MKDKSVVELLNEIYDDVSKMSYDEYAKLEESRSEYLDRIDVNNYNNSNQDFIIITDYEDESNGFSVVQNLLPETKETYKQPTPAGANSIFNVAA
ncbi:MAG: hypothetical protein KAQ69_11530 [Spirochaetales bacterium]|nr:hypothetical protein [Spirochaetales bacterium]